MIKIFSSGPMHVGQSAGDAPIGPFFVSRISDTLTSLRGLWPPPACFLGVLLGSARRLRPCMLCLEFVTAPPAPKVASLWGCEPRWLVFAGMEAAHPVLLSKLLHGGCRTSNSERVTHVHVADARSGRQLPALYEASHRLVLSYGASELGLEQYPARPA